LLAQLLERGLLRDPADLYRLTKEQLLTLDRMGEAEPPAGAAGVLVIGEVVSVREALTCAANGELWRQRARTPGSNEVKYGRL